MKTVHPKVVLVYLKHQWSDQFLLLHQTASRANCTLI